MKLSRREPALRIRRRLWAQLIDGLCRRGMGTRESGAFLLGRPDRSRKVQQVAFFDDLEPGSLTGAVHLTHVAYARLGQICAATELVVLGDVHTHPGSSVAQSHTDRANPLLATPGHLALIVPYFAQGSPRPADVASYRYLGDDGWKEICNGLRHGRMW